MRPRTTDTQRMDWTDTLSARAGGPAVSPEGGQPVGGCGANENDSAALAAIAAAVRGVPHRRVLHLGADRGSNRCGRAEEGPFDLIVSLRTLPTDRLPELPSLSPETYRRGRNLELALARPTPACREVSESLASARRLGRVGGHVVLHERLPGLSQALLFARLLSGAGLLVTEWRGVASASPVASLGGRAGALIVGEVRPSPVPFREEEALASLLPSPGKTTLRRLPRPGSGGRFARSGPEAEAHFRWLSRGAKEVRVAGRRPGGRAFGARFGVAEPPAAYLYYCDTEDVRELDVIDVRLGWDLFAPAAERYALAAADGEGCDVHPPADALFAGLRALLGA
ncbi:MAG: hypothetical protein U0797_07970 [Gemmataceae bacterium]